MYKERNGEGIEEKNLVGRLTKSCPPHIVICLRAFTFASEKFSQILKQKASYLFIFVNYLFLK